MKTIPAFILAVAFISGCSEETTPPRVLSDAEIHDGTVYLKVTSPVSSNSTYSAVDVNITNYTDRGVLFVRCDSFGYQAGVEVATGIGRDMFPPQALSSIPDIEPGQTKSAVLVMDNHYSGVRLDSVEWLCSYQHSGENVSTYFEGRS